MCVHITYTCVPKCLPTVQIFVSCIRRPNNCQCLVVKTPMDNMSTNKASTSIKTIGGPLIGVLGLFLTCYPGVFKQPGTSRRPIDWCRNY